MPLIIEDENKTLGKKQIKVPNKVVQKLKLNRGLFDNYKKSKGYKRINSIIDDNYNKRSTKKDKIKNGDKTISGSDLKRVAHDYSHISQNPNNLEFAIQKPLMQWASDEIKRQRTAVEKVKVVPPVKKLEKDPTKIQDVNKDVKMGNATVKITEEQLLILKEYHDQLVFNFDDNGEPYYKKDNWQHYIDYLEEIGTYGMLPASEWTEQTVSKVIEQVKENIDPYQGGNDIDEYEYLEAFLDVVCQAYIYDKTMDELFEEQFLEKFNDYDKFKETHNYYDECETLKKYLFSKGVIDYNSDELESYLTDLGKEVFQKTIKENFIDNILEYDLEDGLTYNDRGLIYIERNIQIPKFNSPEFTKNHYVKDFKDYYSYLINVYGQGQFGGIGNCFSWKEGKGEAYCAGSFGNGATEIKLKCWIDPKDINWEETVYRNCYSYREEREIYVNSSTAKIEVFDVVIEYEENIGKNMSGKSLLKKPIIVRP